MFIIFERNDHTSICCTLKAQRKPIAPWKTKAITFFIGCTLIIIGTILLLIAP